MDIFQATLRVLRALCTKEQTAFDCVDVVLWSAVRHTVAGYAVLAVRTMQCVLLYAVSKEKKKARGYIPRDTSRDTETIQHVSSLFSIHSNFEPASLVYKWREGGGHF